MLINMETWSASQVIQTNVCTVQVLQKAGLSDAQLVQLSSNLYQLQCAFERMAVIKEYRYRDSLTECMPGKPPHFCWMPIAAVM